MYYGMKRVRAHALYDMDSVDDHRRWYPHHMLMISQGYRVVVLVGGWNMVRCILAHSVSRCMLGACLALAPCRNPTNSHKVVGLFTDIPGFTLLAKARTNTLVWSCVHNVMCSYTQSRRSWAIPCLAVLTACASCAVVVSCFASTRGLLGNLRLCPWLITCV